MQKLHDLKRKLMKELYEYADRPSLSHDDVATVKNLISGVNKICEYMDAEEDKEYSNRMSRDSYSTRKKRDSMGRYSRDEYSRDYSRDYGYSRDGEFMNELHELAERAPEHQKHELMRMIDKLEK